MIGFDLGQLKTFVAVVEAGSLTAAAPQIFLSQSSVSEQMRKLEHRAGKPLLTRSKAGVALTPAGARLLTHARAIAALSEEAYRDLRGEALQGKLRLAVTDYFRPGELTRLLGRLGESYPQVQLHVSILQSSEIEAGYAQGDFDVGLSMRIAGKPGPAAADTGRQPALRRESLLWMGAAGLRLTRGEPVRLVLLPESCALHRFTLKLLQQRRVAHLVAHLASGVAGLQSALAAGLGVACLNESALCPGVARLLPEQGLPALPRVGFHLLPARPGETDFVGRARQLLASQLA